MTRILRGGKTRQPPFSQPRPGGIRRGRDIARVGFSGVRRLIARNPANGISGQLGTEADAAMVALEGDAELNTVGSQTPTTIVSPHDAAARQTTVRVVDRRANRRVVHRPPQDNG